MNERIVSFLTKSNLFRNSTGYTFTNTDTQSAQFIIKLKHTKSTQILSQLNWTRTNRTIITMITQIISNFINNIKYTGAQGAHTL